MPVTERTYKRVALEDPDGHWELDCGELRRKPDMTFEHNQVGELLGHFLRVQLGLVEYVVRTDAGLVRRSASQYYMPDLMVIPMEMVRRLFPAPRAWEV